MRVNAGRAFRKMAPGWGAGRFAEHGDKGAEAVVSNIVCNGLDRLALRQHRKG
jgi:hypothetical protein